MDPTPDTRARFRSAHAAFFAGVSMICGLAATPASAHAILIESNPKADDVVAGPDITFDLRYNSRIDQKRSRLTLKNPDGNKIILPIEPETKVDHLNAHAAGLTPGRYTLRWQVLATDGHITRGDVPFSVTAAPISASQPAVAAGH